MNKKLIQKLSIEALIVVIISALLLVVFGIISADDNRDRIQENYSELFSDVLVADYYEVVPVTNLDQYQGLQAVYEGFNNDGSPVGFITDVFVVTPSETELHLLAGITYDGAELTGISRIHDETNPASISDDEINIIANQAVGSQIPIYVNHQTGVTDADGVSVRIPGLNNGVYYAQTMKPDSNGYIDFVEIEVQNGSIIRVQWDAFNIERTIKNRIAASLSGAYVISGESWATQSYNLCHALIDCQDPASLAMKSDGTTSIVDGVTIEISTFVDLAYECINNSIYGFDKDQYKDGIADIIAGIFNSNFEELGLTNDNGDIVFSFEDYPDTFAVYDEEENIIGYTNVLGITRDVYVEVNSNSIVNPIVVNNGDSSSSVNGAEDGINIGNGNNAVDNIDGIPISEVRTYIDGIPGSYGRSRYVVTAVNVSYRFLKDYLNWMA